MVLLTLTLVLAATAQISTSDAAAQVAMRFLNNLSAHELSPGRTVSLSDYDLANSDLTRRRFYVRIGPFAVGGNAATGQIHHFTYMPDRAEDVPPDQVLELTTDILHPRAKIIHNLSNLGGSMSELVKLRSSTGSGAAEGSVEVNGRISLAGYQLWGGQLYRFDRAGRLLNFASLSVPKPPAEIRVTKTFEEAREAAVAAAMPFVRSMRAGRPVMLEVNEQYTRQQPVLWQPSPRIGETLAPEYQAIRDADSCLAVYAIVLDAVNQETGRGGPAARVMVDAHTGTVISCGGP